MDHAYLSPACTHASATSARGIRYEGFTFDCGGWRALRFWIQGLRVGGLGLRLGFKASVLRVWGFGAYRVGV